MAEIDKDKLSTQSNKKYPLRELRECLFKELSRGKGEPTYEVLTKR